MTSETGRAHVVLHQHAAQHGLYAFTNVLQHRGEQADRYTNGEELKCGGHWGNPVFPVFLSCQVSHTNRGAMSGFAESEEREALIGEIFKVSGPRKCCCAWATRRPTCRPLTIGRNAFVLCHFGMASGDRGPYVRLLYARTGTLLLLCC